MQQKLRERIFERWVFYEEISPKTAFKLSNDMSSQQVSGTHKKLAEFCKKRNITRHSFERLSEYQPVLVMPKKFAEMRWNGKNLRKHNKSIVKNRNGEVSSCDILYSNDLNTFNQDYLKYTAQVADSCQDCDLSADSMVIGTSAIVDTEIDGAVGMNSGIFNNPFIIWGRYKKKFFRYYLPISFQFHHTQMDGAHAGRFLANLQHEISELG